MPQLGFIGDDVFVAKKFYAFGGTGSGESASNPAAIVDHDAIVIPAGVIVDEAAVVITAAVTGTTVIELGDDDDADGFIPAASITLGTPGLYGWGEDQRGVYLASGANQRAKYYPATGKEVKVNTTTANTAGAFYVLVSGYYMGR